MFLLHNLANLPPEIITLIISAVPIVELRGAIPLAILKYNLPPFEAFTYGVIGSLIPCLPILYVLEFIEPILRKSKGLSNLLDKIFERTRNKSKIIQEWKFIGLVLFIGIPAPGTGVWTGTLAAYLFGISKPKALLAALLGTTLAGIIMTVVSVFFANNLHLLTQYFVFIVALIIGLVIWRIRRNGNN